MKKITYILLLTQLTLIFGSTLLTQYKCRLWDTPCLTINSQVFLPTFTAGLPELGTERLDTMFIDGFHIDDSGYIADWKNVHLSGLKDAVIDSLSIDTNLKLIRLLFHTDLSLKSDYKNEGYLLSMPFNGEGEATLTFYGTQMELIMPFDIVKDAHGRDIMDIKSFEYWYDIKNGVNMYFDNLYYGNEELSKQMHIALHQNWKQLTKKYARYLFDLSNEKIFNAIRCYMRSQPLQNLALY